MVVVVIEPPSEFPVSLDDAKAQCRATGFDDDDVLLQGLIESATGWLDGPSGWLGRALISQVLELRLDGFPHRREGRRERRHTIDLPLPPLTDVESIIFIAEDGSEQTVDSTTYRATTDGVLPCRGSSWPQVPRDPESVRIRYTAGYGATGDKVPRPIRNAILMLVAHWYAHPEAVVGVDNRDSSTELPLGVSSLLANFRVIESF